MDILNNIEVSVICLAYNHEKYIRSALQGFVEQITNFEYEVLIHDDASTDQTADIIKEFEEKYPDIIKPIYQKENQHSQGIKILSTHLLPKVQGKYIAYCEGDDFWTDPHKLQRQYDILEKNQECSLCVHRVNCLNEDDSPNERTIPESNYGINSDMRITKTELCKLYWLKGGYPFHTSSYFMRKEIHDINIELKRDIGTLKKCLLIGDAYYINTPMSARRLMTIGNFNQRLKAGGIKARLKMIEDDIQGDYNLAQYSDGLIKKYALYGVLERILAISNHDPKHGKALLKKYKVNFYNSVVVANAKIRIKYFFKYYLLKICPANIYIKIVKKPDN